MNLEKIAYFDVETGGLDPHEHGLLQIALIIEVDGLIKEQDSWFVRPYPQDKIDRDALQINGIEQEAIETFREPRALLRDVILPMLTRHIDRFDRSDKFTPAGYNVRFDIDFLRQWFFKGGEKYYGSYFNYRFIDPLPLLYWLCLERRIVLPDYKLTTVCNHLGIDIVDAHDAMADIRATREVIKHLRRSCFSHRDLTTQKDERGNI